MPLAAGKLRHRIHIERRSNVQDSETGAIVETWVPAFAGSSSGAELIPASIEPLSGNQFIAAQAEQSKIVANIVIRYRAGIDHTMRAVHGEAIYNIEAVLPDPESGLEALVLKVSSGVNQG